MSFEVLKAMFTLPNILMMNIGLAAGTVIGAMPGLNVIFAIAILLPIAFGMDSLPGMYLMLASYCGATYGGSITAILINTPGTPAASATTFDGYPMAQQGRAGDALKIALVGSTLGGLISCFALLFFAPTVARIAYHIASPEYFALCLFGMCAVIGMSERNIFKGIIMSFLGLAVSTVGISMLDGTSRFTFGNSNLLAGFRQATVILGVFAISEVLIKLKNISGSDVKDISANFKKSTLKTIEILRHWKTVLVSSVIGVVVGAIPGTGGALSAMFSYDTARRMSKHPESFGKGELEGVLAPEAGNNAVTGATLIPLLTLGIPGDAAVAVLLGALTMQGVTPGFALFNDGSPWVWAIMLGLILINIFMFLQGQLFVRAFVNVTKVPMIVLLPCIVIATVMGAFAISNTTFDVFVMISFGVLAYILRRFDFPIAPFVIGLVLGEIAEVNLRRSMMISKGSFAIFLTRPISLVIIILSVLLLCMPFIKRALAAASAKRSAKKETT